MSRSRRTHHGFGLVVIVTSLLAAAGCGGEAVEGPGGSESGAAPQRSVNASPAATDGGADSDGRGDGESFSWGLPGGDLSLDTLGDVFNTLKAGRCAEAEGKLESFLQNEQVFSSRGQELLYRAAIAVCSGDLDAGRESLRGAALTNHPGDCRAYKAIKSVLDQRPQEPTDCPAPQATGKSTDGLEEPTTGPEGQTTEPSTPSSTQSTPSAVPTPDASPTPAAGDGGALPTGEGGSDSTG